MCLGQVEDCKALSQISRSPGGQLRVADLPVFECSVEQPLCLMGIGCIEDAAYLSGHWRALVQATDVALRVVLQVKLATLPGHAGKHRLARCFKARMVIAGDELDPSQAALNQAVQKGLRRSSPAFDSKLTGCAEIRGWGSREN